MKPSKNNLFTFALFLALVAASLGAQLEEEMFFDLPDVAETTPSPTRDTRSSFLGL